MHYNAQNAQISDFSPGFRLLSNKASNTKKKLPPTLLAPAQIIRQLNF